MKEIVVKNKRVLELLNESLYFMNHLDELNKITPDDNDKKAEDYLNEEYRTKIKNMGSAHNGFPEILKGYPLKSYSEHSHHSDKIGFSSEWLEKYNNITQELGTELAVRNLAVHTIYPPGGFISYHNNANATGFNLIFTWSETGDGYFEYRNGSNGEDYRIQDRKGEWVCRYGMFGSYYQDEHPIVYHEAYTDCWRMTIAFVFSKDESSAGLQEFVIEELETP